ncbi:MAG: hypothetical protein HYX62_04695 [Gammaproteobacteria bacterium]|nr:hypothetical protein [Gammaproteobacteria bacterium]
MSGVALDWGRKSKYRQGVVLTEAVAEQALAGIGFGQRAVVISHDCDIASDTNKEPNIEVLLATVVTDENHAFLQAKNPRQLHLVFVHQGNKCVLDLRATEKRCVHKENLIDTDPDPDFLLTENNRQILQRWLAARYRRHAFPDKLNNRIKHSFGKAEEWLKKKGAGIIAVYIDYQPRNEELSDSAPYELWVYVVADSSAVDGMEQAKALAAKLEEGLAETKGVDLREIEAKSDLEFTLFDSRRTFEFRLEHLSFRSTPFGPMAES